MKCVRCDNSHVTFTPIQSMLTRRDVVQRLSVGLGGFALASLFRDASADEFTVRPKPPHVPPKAKAVILLFQNGGPSHVDLFDPKPELVKRAGQKPGEGYVNTVNVSKTGTWLRSPFAFKKHGQSGMELSELLPNLGRHADDIALIRSMITEHSNHEQAIWNFNTGLVTPGRPAMGAWITYGLGTLNRDLPAYVAIMNPTGLPVDGVRNFSSGFLPPMYQGFPMRAEGTPVLNLQPRTSQEAADGRLQFLRQLNREHLAQRPGQLELEARIQSFELAARMQLAASDALDLSKEPAHIHTLYGTDKPTSATYARQLLLARRLVERGVRFVQVLHAGQPWDTHSNNDANLRTLCARQDQPDAALLADLKQRGLLDETLVIWGGEFGRTPMAEGANGRDHHKYAFSLWMAGGGIKGGVTHGATDEFGYRSVENVVTTADLHATILHQLGLHHRRLDFQTTTRAERLTDVHEARIVREILT